MEEEASVKMAIANVCGVNATDIRIVMGGRDTIKEKIKNKMITPEILYAMDKAIISILINKDLEDACLGMNPQGNPKMMRQQLEDSGRGFALRETAERLKAARFVASQAKITVADAPAAPADAPAAPADEAKAADEN